MQEAADDASWSCGLAGENRDPCLILINPWAGARRMREWRLDLRNSSVFTVCQSSVNSFADVC